MAFKIILAFYLIVAVAMIFFILMQRGAGAQAGSGFGAGASGTVFGASGSANFLSISTKWLAVAFFAISIGMGVYVSKQSRSSANTDLGVMAEADKTDEAAKSEELPSAAPSSETPLPAATPEVPAAEIPAANSANETAPVKIEKVPEN